MLCLANETQDWKHGFIVPGKTVSAGWGTGREVGEKSWHEFLFSPPATMRALRRWVTYLCPRPTLVQSTSISPSQFPLLPNMPYPKATPRVYTQYS